MVERLVEKIFEKLLRSIAGQTRGKVPARSDGCPEN